MHISANMTLPSGHQAMFEMYNTHVHTHIATHTHTCIKYLKVLYCIWFPIYLKIFPFLCNDYFSTFILNGLN